MNENTITNTNKKSNTHKTSLLSLSIIGVILSLLSFGTFVAVLTGSIFLIVDSFQSFWIPVLITCIIVFLVSWAANIILYSKVILSKNHFVKNDENEFPFWTSAFIFWLLPIFSWSIFIALHFKEIKGSN
ncbi:MAG: hypothetical protein ACRC9F_02160 [Metamycoplasmataceae bacterium]